jgi:hypothetical protein
MLSSDARNKAAFAISSGLPIRPKGTVLTMFVSSCSVCSSLCTTLLNIGVSIIPGLMALTRILRCFRSTVQVRANDLIDIVTIYKKHDKQFVDNDNSIIALLIRVSETSLVTNSYIFSLDHTLSYYND